MTVPVSHRTPPSRPRQGLFNLLAGWVRRSGPACDDDEPPRLPVLHPTQSTADGLHDLRTALMVLSACAERLSERVPRAVADDELADLREYVRRAVSISTELLRAAEPGPAAPSPSEVDLNDVVTPVIATLSRCLGRGMRLRLRLSAGPLRVVADPVEIEKILLNLAINGIEAMGHTGLLTITTGRVAEGSPLPTANPQVRVARLVVSDTGCDMTHEAMAGMSQPFCATTEGAGLGFSSAATAVKKLGGTIALESAPGRGTSITVDLPCIHTPTPPFDS